MDVKIIEGETVQLVVNMPVGFILTPYTILMQVRKAPNSNLIFQKASGSGITATTDSFVVIIDEADTLNKPGNYLGQFKLSNGTQKVLFKEFNFTISSAIAK